MSGSLYHTLNEISFYLLVALGIGIVVLILFALFSRANSIELKSDSNEPAIGQASRAEVVDPFVRRVVEARRQHLENP